VRPNGAAARSPADDARQLAVVGLGGPPCVRSARSTLCPETPPTTTTGLAAADATDRFAGDKEPTGSDDDPQPAAATSREAAIKPPTKEGRTVPRA